MAGRAFDGWRIVGASALLVGGMTAWVLAQHGTGEEGSRALLRATARSSLLFLLAAFSASSLRRVWNRPLTRWLVRNRRQLGVSLAVSHAVHGVALVALVRQTGNVPPATTLLAGGLAYLFLAAMAATSFDRSAAWLGPRAWRRLHLVGIHLLWFVFLFTYLGVAIATPGPVPIVSCGLLVGALALRIVVRVRLRRRERALAEPQPG